MRRSWVAVQTGPWMLAAIAGLPAPAVAQPKPDVPVQTFALADDRPASTKPAPVPLSRVLGVDVGEVPFVLLGPVNTVQLAEEDAREAASGEKRLRYGLGRDVNISEANGRWIDVPAVAGGGGRLWVGDILAAGAMGIRAHLVGMDLPRGAQVVAYSLSDPSRIVGPYESKGPFDDGKVWTPTRAGERLRIECYVPGLPHGKVPAQGLFRVDRIQHIYRDPVQGGTDVGCHNDVMCFPQWATTAKACAGIGFISNNALYCSGQLLNTLTSDQTPYYLTANHCISTTPEAQSSEVYFNYRTAVCDGLGPSPANVPQAAVCTLLSTGMLSDYTLLMIEGAIPTGLAWAGWTSVTPGDGTSGACIHFPLGSFERISFGTKASDVTCGGSDHIRMNWTSGPTETGSSGGGVFTNDANQQLFGQLHCGPSACGNVTNDDFGDFASTYQNISWLLNSGSDDSIEPNNTCATAIFLAPGTYNGLIVKSTAEDWFKISVGPGNVASVQLWFTNAYGDIDVRVYDGCGGTMVTSSAGQSNSELVAWSNPTTTMQTAYVRVFLASDTRNAYNMVITNGVPPPLGACCLGNGTCTQSTAANCASLSGAYRGDGVTCGSAECPSVYSYVGAAVPIPDGTGTAGCGAVAIAQVTVPDSFTLANVETGVFIQHPYQGDVKFSLRHVPTGTTVPLESRPGVLTIPPFGFSTDNYGAGPAALFQSSDAAAQVYDWPVPPVNNVVGTWKPLTPLAAFAGEIASGAWQLLAQDCSGGDIGSIVSFRLTLTPQAAPCYVNCDQSTAPPILNTLDFSCFITRFAAGESYANCDGSSQAPVLNSLDFSCFLNQFAAGCT